jgi:hypothetical protein
MEATWRVLFFVCVTVAWAQFQNPPPTSAPTSAPTTAAPTQGSPRTNPPSAAPWGMTLTYPDQSTCPPDRIQAGFMRAIPDPSCLQQDPTCVQSGDSRIQTTCYDIFVSPGSFPFRAPNMVLRADYAGVNCNLDNGKPAFQYLGVAKADFLSCVTYGGNSYRASCPRLDAFTSEFRWSEWSNTLNCSGTPSFNVTTVFTQSQWNGKCLTLGASSHWFFCSAIQDAPLLASSFLALFFAMFFL